jgi:transposase-like protein
LNAHGVVLVQVDVERPRCRVCGSLDVGTAGKHLRASTAELVQNYKCRRCGSTFLPDVYRMGKTPRGVVDLAVKLARDGMPLEQIVRELPARTGLERSHTTVRRWIAFHAPEVSWRQRESPFDPRVLRAIKHTPTRPRVPSFGLDDARSPKRVLLDDEITAKAHELIRGRYSAYSSIYHSLYSNGRAVWGKGRWAPMVRFYRRVSRDLGISRRETERHVLAVYSGKSGRSKAFAGPLPVKANGGFAFLMGLFYSAGGIGAQTLHFAVDRQVAEYMQEELADEVRESPVVISQGSEAHGTRSATYGRTMLMVLKKFGLKTADPVQLGHGKYVPSRYLALGIPNWVRREPYFLHRFVEGYVNGLKLSVGLEGRLDGRRERLDKGYSFYPTVYCTAKVSFCCRDVKQLEEFALVVVRHLKSLGASPGYLSKARQDGRAMQHRSYSWHTLAGLRNFRDNFLVIRPTARLKLGLRLSRDPVIKHILERTRGLDNYILGSLIEGPKSEDVLASECPRRPYNMSTQDLLRPSIERLSAMRVIRQVGSQWEYEPSIFVVRLIDYYRKRVQTEQRQRATVKQARAVTLIPPPDGRRGRRPSLRSPGCPSQKPRLSQLAV